MQKQIYLPNLQLASSFVQLLYAGKRNVLACLLLEKVYSTAFEKWSEFLSRTTFSHFRITRQSISYTFLRFKTSYGATLSNVVGPTLWNYLSKQMKNECYLNAFAKQMKNMSFPYSVHTFVFCFNCLTF